MPFGNRSKKYWIIPQESLAPDDLVLGSILKKPNDPIDILNRRTVAAIDESLIIHEREQVTKSLGDAIDSGFGAGLGASSVLAAVLGAAPTIEGNWAHGVSDKIEATRVRAQHFVPPADYVNKALRTPEMDSYVRQSFFSAPVYMVVGVAVASTLTRTANASGDRGGKAGVGFGPPGTGVEVSAELSANRNTKSNYSDSVEGDVVLAYRLRRFRYSKRRDEFVKKDEDETKHARYGTDEDDVEEHDDDEVNEVAVFSYFEGEDVAGDADMHGFEEPDDDEGSDSSDD
ncbi:dynamin family protein [Purpureocillium lavendulum]|uniref:Dynamin family protein n=1 Tax=Purpureocillium lavendulum TaxID=1247861 RepID=A0AB34FGH5_9HYPO|nr:dynamin family protein [Purpureocillium lavendulum]